MKRNFCSYILFLLLLLFATTGCAGTSEGSSKDSSYNESTGEKIESDYVYVPTFSRYDINVPTEENGDICGSVGADFIKEDTLYTLISYYPVKGVWHHSVVMTDIATGEQIEKDIDNLDYYDTVNGFAGYDAGAKIIYFYDRNFEKTGEMDIYSVVSGLKDNGMTFTLNDIVVDNEGNIGIAGGDAVLLFDSEYNLIRNIGKPNYVKQIKKLMVTQNGNWYVYCYSNSSLGTIYYTNSVYPLDMEHGGFGGEIGTSYETTFADKIYYIADGGFYYGGSSYIYWYDEKNATIEEVFCMTDYGITIAGSSSCMGNEGEIYIAGGQGGRGRTVEYEVAAIKKLPESEAKERTEIILGCFGRMNNDPVLWFNKHNADYYCTIKDYLASDDDEETARQNFYNDMIEGRGADVFVFPYGSNGYIDIEGLGEKGILADLYEFMDNDDELSREDFIPNVLKQMENDNGKLYVLYDFFEACGFAGKKSIFGGCDEWNYVTLLEIMREHPDALLEIQLTREDMLEKCLQYSMGIFYNTDTGECSFESDEFKAMLEILALIPEKLDSEQRCSLPELLDTERVLLYFDYLSSGTDVRVENMYFGNSEVEYLGFPASGGMAAISFSKGVAVNAQSENRKGAWELVKSYFINRVEYSMPVIQEHFDEYVEELYPGETDVYDGYIHFTNVQVTDGDWQMFNTFIDNAVSWRDYDADIYTIIDEEAQGYFAGVKSLDDTAATIQNRVKLYIDEKR